MRNPVLLRSTVRLTRVERAFPGRVVFDHLPKTAGQAVNAWLQAELGPGCVTRNLIGDHRDLLGRFGGRYSVISGHLRFDGSGLDPRYDYVTFLREPVDRALSWLCFVASKHEPELADLRRKVHVFLANEGDAEFPESPEVRHPYVEHFWEIESDSTQDEAALLRGALDAIEQYRVWGFLDQLPAFLADFSALLQVAPPKSLRPVNVTPFRIGVGGISNAFRQRLEDLFALDIEFYRTLRGRYAAARSSWNRPAFDMSCWTPFDGNVNRRRCSPEFTLVSAHCEYPADASSPSAYVIELDFSVAHPVEGLEVRVRITDEDGVLAFSASQALTGESGRALAAGRHRLRMSIEGRLPLGEYQVGFVFVSRLGNSRRALATLDALLTLRVSCVLGNRSAGYANLALEFENRMTSTNVVQVIQDGRGEIACEDVPTEVRVNDDFTLTVRVENKSEQVWEGQLLHPINLSYRWSDTQNRDIGVEARRTPLPVPALAPGESIIMGVAVTAPPKPGRYSLSVLPVQELVCWFDQCGGEPFGVELLVTPEGSRSAYDGEGGVQP